MLMEERKVMFFFQRINHTSRLFVFEKELLIQEFYLDNRELFRHHWLDLQ